MRGDDGRQWDHERPAAKAGLPVSAHRALRVLPSKMLGLSVTWEGPEHNKGLSPHLSSWVRGSE